MNERFFIYVQDNLPTMAAGQTLTNVPLALSSDAPFVLRGRSLTLVETPEVGSLFFVNAMYTRYRDAADRYNATDLLPVQYDIPNGGAMGPSPVYPQKAYPAGSQILVDIYNGTGQPVTPILYWHGVKLYPDGTYPLTYPAKCKLFPYSYTLPGPGRAPLVIQPTDFIQDYTLTIQGDADYVMRAGCGGLLGPTEGGPGFHNLYVTMKDHERKPYSSGPVHIYHLLSSSFSPAANTANPLAGDWTPGLFVPEIYVRRNDMMYFDFLRLDGAAGFYGETADTLQFVFSGVKVFV